MSKVISLDTEVLLRNSLVGPKSTLQIVPREIRIEVSITERAICKGISLIDPSEMICTERRTSKINSKQINFLEIERAGRTVSVNI